MANKILKNMIIALTPELIEVKESERKGILSKYHNDPLYGGHIGIKRMLSKVKSKYLWKNMTKDITNYIKNFKKCQINKSGKKTKEKLTITPIAQTAFDIVAIDTIGPFCKTNKNYEYAVTVVYDLTKYLIIIPKKNKKAHTVAKAIFENVILIYGPVRRILTDCGTEYINDIFKNVLKLFNI